MKRIYTRTGDAGTTGIHGGDRVPKTDARIEANGTLDELNVAIGIVRSMLPADSPRQPWLREVQMNLMTVMSRVATPSARLADNPNPLPADMTARVEQWLDTMAYECGPAEYFMLPGGTQVSAFMHQARVTARRAERCLWALNDKDPVEKEVLTYVNRLSDLFFMMARAELAAAGLPEERWREFVYKRRSK